MSLLHITASNTLAKLRNALFYNGPRALARGSITIRQEIHGIVTAPAQGDLFDFSAETVLQWTSPTIKRKHFPGVIDEYVGRATDVVDRQTLHLARQFPPDQAEELQTALNHALADLNLCYYIGNHELHCRPFVRIGLDEEVRRALRPTMLDKLRQAGEYDTKMRRTELVDTLARRWSRLLDDLKDEPHITHAAKLTAKDFAEVLSVLDETREHDAAELLELLREAIDGADGMAISPYEWAKGFDKLINKQPGASELGDEPHA